MRIVVGLEYCGAGFCGWQSQPQRCGVQDALEAAVSAIACQPVSVTAAGRTDTGVHAAFQVAHFDVTVDRPLTAWVRGVNSHLPPGVAVLWARAVSEDFHARFAAVQRGYRYVLLNHPVRPGLDAGRVGWHHRPLDAAAMSRAAAHVIGVHDFSAFRAAECQAKSPVKALRSACIVRRGDYLLCDFHADGFLHHMVRNLMGSLIPIGRGEKPESWMAELLAGRDRAVAGPTAPPEGLLFLGALYPAEWGLPPEVTL